MDFAFETRAAKYAFIMHAIFCRRQSAILLNKTRIDSIKKFFAHLARRGAGIKNGTGNLALSIALFLNCNNDKTMSKNFCDCLKQDDWACIKKEVDKYLNTLDKNEQEDNITADFKKWLMKNECIQEVDIQQGLIETNPPIKQFALKITTPNGIMTKTIGVQISKTVLKAYIH